MAWGYGSLPSLRVHRVLACCCIAARPTAVTGQRFPVVLESGMQHCLYNVKESGVVRVRLRFV